MQRVLILIVFLSNTIFGQTRDRVQDNFGGDYEYSPDNLVDKYTSFDYDFSKVWTTTDNKHIFGIIGEKHQRIHIKLISMVRLSNTPLLYNVFGKSMVNDHICDFDGIIVIREIREAPQLNFGVDNEHKNKGIQTQGMLIADYELYEDKNQKHSGVFKGTLHSKWYLDANNQIQYDDTAIVADGFLNNAFVGNWKSNKTGEEKICNWADYRVPLANSDFDIGTGEFSVSEKYVSNGWLDIALQNKIPNSAIIGKAKSKKKKEWWE
ncbi:MAG: hypothetical protein ACWA5P_10935 [bacterium]